MVPMSMKMREIGQGHISKEAGIVHVCVPFLRRERLVDIVYDYGERLKPRLVILSSTGSAKDDNECKQA